MIVFFFNHFRTDAFSTFTLVKELFQYFYQYAWTCTTLQKELFFLTNRAADSPGRPLRPSPCCGTVLPPERRRGSRQSRRHIGDEAPDWRAEQRCSAPGARSAPGRPEGARCPLGDVTTTSIKHQSFKRIVVAWHYETVYITSNYFITAKKKLQETTYNQDNTTTKQTYSPLYEAQGATANRERHAANWRSRSILKTQVSSCGEGSVFTGESDLKADIHTVTSLRYGAVQPIRGRHEFVKQTKLTQTRRNFVHNNKNNNNEKYV